MRAIVFKQDVFKKFVFSQAWIESTVSSHTHTLHLTAVSPWPDPERLSAKEEAPGIAVFEELPPEQGQAKSTPQR